MHQQNCRQPIARYPVTVAQFAQFIKASSYQTTAEKGGWAYGWSGSNWQQIKGAYWAHPRGPNSHVQNKMDHPVTCVSWLDANEFCHWASVRLPSEAEWEKAARWPDGRIYPWGNEVLDNERCNFNMAVGDTMPVGNYPTGKSFYGVLQMAGNVWEWTSSIKMNLPETIATETVTLQVPGQLYAYAQQTVGNNQQALEQLLVSALVSGLSLLDDLPDEMVMDMATLALLNDRALWRVARQTMAEEHYARMDELLALKKTKDA